jgi:DNA invertase Pin-like site-specific DNA recombinase
MKSCTNIQTLFPVPERNAQASINLLIEFVSSRENIDTGGPLGRAMLTIIGAISALELDLIRERILAGMRRAKLEGRRIGRVPLEIDRVQVVADRRAGMSLSQVAQKHRISRASVCRLVKEPGGVKKPSVPQLGNERVVPPTGSSNLPAAA